MARGRTRAPVTPGKLFLAHSLAIAELYVRLREAERRGELHLASFAVESAAWHTDDRGGVLKPDAYVCIRSADLEDVYWVEVDMATESVPTLKRKLLTYVEFATSGGIGPDGVMPRILLAVPQERRLVAVRGLVDVLPALATELILMILSDSAVEFMITTLRS